MYWTRSPTQACFPLIHESLSSYSVTKHTRIYFCATTLQTCQNLTACVDLETSYRFWHLCPNRTSLPTLVSHTTPSYWSALKQIQQNQPTQHIFSFRKEPPARDRTSSHHRHHTVCIPTPFGAGLPIREGHDQLIAATETMCAPSFEPANVANNRIRTRRSHWGFSHRCRCSGFFAACQNAGCKTFSHWGCVKDFAKVAKWPLYFQCTRYCCSVKNPFGLIILTWQILCAAWCPQNLRQRHQCESHLGLVALTTLHTCPIVPCANWSACSLHFQTKRFVVLTSKKLSSENHRSTRKRVQSLRR